MQTPVLFKVVLYPLSSNATAASGSEALWGRVISALRNGNSESLGVFTSESDRGGNYVYLRGLLGTCEVLIKVPVPSHTLSLGLFFFKLTV